MVGPNYAPVQVVPGQQLTIANIGSTTVSYGVTPGSADGTLTNGQSLNITGLPTRYLWTTSGNTDGTVRIYESGLTRGFNIVQGDLTVATGDVAVTAGDLTVAAGDVDVTAGDFDVTAGTATFGGTTVGAGEYIPPYPLPAGAIAETFPRAWTETSEPLADGTLNTSAIVLKAGDVVTSIGFISGTTPTSGGSNFWVALYDGSRNLMAQSVNDTGSTNIGNTEQNEIDLATPQTITTTGIHYIGIMVDATQPPTIACSSASSRTYAQTLAPAINGNTSDTSLTTTAPATAAAVTAQTDSMYFYVL